VCYNNCGGQGHGSTWTASCPSGQTGTITYSCNNGSTTETGRACLTPYSCSEAYECVTDTKTCGVDEGGYNAVANYGDCVNINNSRSWGPCKSGYAISNNVRIGVRCLGPNWSDIKLDILGICTREKTCYQ
jgi:hypothetical protein